jgi:hypothetical protein
MFRDFMPAKNRIEQLLQEVKVQAKAMGVDINGYKPHVARQGEEVLAFVFYPTNLGKKPILIPVKQTCSGVEICTPYASSNYGIQKMLWCMGADGHSVQSDIEKACS